VKFAFALTLPVAIIICCALFSCLPASAHASSGERIEVFVDGLKRTYEIHLPKAASTRQWNNGVPLVLVLHGAFGNAWSAKFNSGMSAKSDQEGFFVAYPNGAGNSLHTWNAGRCCGLASKNNADDIKFIRKLIEDMIAHYGVDPDRVYVTGISNGAMLAYRAACDLSDLIAAVSPVEGCMSYEQAPAQPVSVLAFNGTRDPIVRYAGGGNFFGYKIKCPGVSDTIKFWVRQNECTVVPIVEKVDTVEKQTYKNGKLGTEVALYTLQGGHTWPGGRIAILPFISSHGPLNATDEMCKFFWAHPKLHPAASNR
jgi:polyhydroxybutyrate depolymerase